MNIKNISVQLLKVGFLSVLTILLLVGAVSYSLKNKKADNAYAISSGENGSTDITGEAWSENIGWIRFNGVATDGNPYGVGMKEVDGVGRLSGHAWADKDHIGWISFNRSETGNPPASASYDPGLSQTGQPLAYIDTDGITVKGWARALAACDSVPCLASGAGTNTGGWDGWIALGDTKPSINPVFGVTLNTATKQFEGFAWGSDVVGWVSFNKSNCDSDSNGKVDVACGSDNSSISIGDYKVATTFELNQAPNAPSDLTIEPNVNSYCGSGSISFKWKFTDPNVNSPQNQQSKYKIEASYNAGGPFSIVRETDQVADNNEIVNALVPLSEIKSDLGNDWYNQILYWKVTVWDNGVSQKQSPTASTNYNLPNNEYTVNFTSNPALSEIHADQDVEFSDTSKVYNSASPGGVDLNMDNVSSVCGVNCSRLWDFSANAVPPTSTLANQIVKFSKSISTTVSLTFADTDRYGAGYSCSFSQNIGVKLPIPKFEEKK